MRKQLTKAEQTRTENLAMARSYLKVTKLDLDAACRVVTALHKMSSIEKLSIGISGEHFELNEVQLGRLLKGLLALKRARKHVMRF